MAKRTRPSLASLSGQVGSASRQAISAPETASAHEQPRETLADSAVRHGEAAGAPRLLSVRVNGPGWLEISRLAQDLGKSIEDLTVESCNDVLLKYGRPPVVEGQQMGREGTPASGQATSMPSSLLFWPGLAGAWWWYQAVTAPVLKVWISRADAGHR